jgi:hypothetical protein
MLLTRCVRDRCLRFARSCCGSLVLERAHASQSSSQTRRTSCRGLHREPAARCAGSRRGARGGHCDRRDPAGPGGYTARRPHWSHPRWNPAAHPSGRLFVSLSCMWTRVVTLPLNLRLRARKARRYQTPRDNIRKRRHTVARRYLARTSRRTARPPQAGAAGLHAVRPAQQTGRSRPPAFRPRLAPNTTTCAR